MKISTYKERMLDLMDRLTMVRSYQVINPERKSDNYWFIYAKIPGFFLFKGKTNTGGNIIEIGPCINWTKYILVIEWY
jgi:hypothetical protein